MINKKWYSSKTLWFNILSLLVIIIQSAIGQQFIPIDMQATLLAIINLGLRAFATNSNIIK